jgi:hypothetical protein
MPFQALSVKLYSFVKTLHTLSKGGMFSMKKFLMLGAIVALVAALLAVPALAQRNGDLVSFDDCFPFCDNGAQEQQANQAFEQEADLNTAQQDSERARFANEEDDFFGFLADRFDNEEEFFDFFDERFDENNGAGAEPVVSQQIGQEAESGDLSIQGSVTQSGDNSNQCAPVMQFGNTGNLQNAQGFLQYNSTADDVEFSGGSFEFSPSMGVQCDQAVQQSAAASG